MGSKKRMVCEEMEEMMGDGLKRGERKATRRGTNRKRKGLTMVELIVAITLSVVVFALGIQLFSMTAGATQQVVEETNIQSETRIFAEKVNSAVRYSKALFTIPRNSFRVDNLTKDWNYLGVLRDVTIPAAMSKTGASFVAKEALVQIESLEGGPPSNLGPGESVLTCNGDFFLQRILGYSFVDKHGNTVNYSLIFEKGNSNQMDSKIGYTLKAELRDANGQKVGQDYLDIKTEIEALNSLQVVHSGSDLNPAVALAYRTKDATNVVVNIVLLVDTSGSMEWRISGLQDRSNERIDTLKEKAKLFVNDMSSESEVWIGIMPFSSSVKYGLDYSYLPRELEMKLFYKELYKNASLKKGTLIEQIGKLKPYGGTNHGDGLRMARYSLISRTAELEKEKPKPTVMNYVVFFTDGVYSSTSYDDSSGRWHWSGSERYQLGDGWAVRDVGGDPTYEPDFSNAEAYMKAVARQYTNKGSATTKYSGVDDLFYIAFSSSVNSYVNDTFKSAFSLDSNHMFLANDQLKLENAFKSIKDQIIRDLWQLRGPKR